MSTAEDRLATLEAQIRSDLALLAYPAGGWVAPMDDRAGNLVYDVAIVGGGQSGMAAAQGLIRDGVTNIVLLDRNPEGFEGPWETFARMAMLRTPKYLVGMEHGIPSLSTRAWYEAKFGPGSWAAVDRIARTDWMDYLRWYRRVLNLPICNGVAVVGMTPEGDWLVLSLRTPAGDQLLRARRVVLATGYDGAGAWRIPPEIAAALPAERCRHSNTAIDFAAYRGKRLGILGHGASAFDAAVAALRAGAASVDLCFRRAELPAVNPHRHIEYAGLLKHFPELDDAIRWAVNVHFDAIDQPPAQYGYETALAHENFAIHPASPWLAVGMEGTDIQVRTPQRRFVFDAVICATGSVVDLACRPELAGLAGDIALWRDRYAPPPDQAHERLGLYPYLGPYYDLTEREPGAAPHVAKVHAFNFAAIVSMGPHSTSASGHKFAIPRLVRGLTRSLFLEQQGQLLDGLYAYRETEIDWPPKPRSQPPE